ncbi:MAG: hypothetical protein ACRDPK_21105 [Carbonactinosporaceae bacterium]
MHQPPRVDDIIRHLDDLRTGTYEGAGGRGRREELFERACALLDPVVRRVLAETDRLFLASTGRAGHFTHTDGDGGRYAAWELSWPRQRDAVARSGVQVPPIQVVAVFGATNTHPHLRGTRAGDWPLQVTTEADALRQEPVVRAIVESELHQRIFEGGWTVVPSYADRHRDGRAGDQPDASPAASPDAP